MRSSNVKQVEQFVGPSSKNGQRWRKYLRREGLKQQLADEKAKSMEGVDATLAQLNRNVSGLENRRFRALAKALRRYRDTAVLSLLPKPDEFYNQTLQSLQADLGRLSQRALAEDRASAERTNQHYQ